MGIKITNLPTTAVNEADYLAVANTRDGTRKVLMQDVLDSANVEVDSNLNVTSSNPVKNSAVAAAINALSANVSNLEEDVDLGCLTPEIKSALLACFQQVAWIGDDGQDYYDALYDALYNRYWVVTNTLTNCTTSNETTQVVKGSSYSATITASTGYVMEGATVSVTMGGTDITSSAYSNGTISIASVTGALVITISAAAKTVSSISAVYTQSGTVYDTDSLDDIKDDLVVTATYSDSSTATIAANDYTLSGTLAEGTNTITVSYGGQTATFRVEVTASPLWVFTSGYTCAKGTSGASKGNIWRQIAAARAVGAAPIENNGYVFTVTDSAKYNLAAYDVTSLDSTTNVTSSAIDGYGYVGGSKSVSWKASDSVTTSYVWLALKKMDGSEFTAEELADGAAAVFTYTES